MRERVREALGVWMPMGLGFLLIAVAVNFLLTPRTSSPDPLFPIDPLAAAVCAGVLVLVGAVLVLSTYGRLRKARATR